jgi:LacI family transcriptional regulator
MIPWSAMKAAPTMKDVARACGYSPAAVSLALRGHASIPPRTREEIAEAAKKLGYRTSPLVSALMSLHRQQRPANVGSAVIAYLTSHPADDPWRTRSFYVRMFSGASERAAETGCRVEEINLRARGITPPRAREILRARGIHAAIVAPLAHGETSIDFDFTGLAVVGLGMSVRTPVIERVSNDHFQSAVLAFEQCLALGYRRIGFLISQETSRRLDHRWVAGYRFAVEEHPLDQRIPPLMPERQREVAALIPGWVRSHRPDVVILGNAEFELQAQVSTNVGLVSLGVDTPDGPISGIYQDDRLVGRVTADHVIAKLFTNNLAPIDRAYIHLVAGRWAAGITAPGPGRRRPSAATLKAQGLAFY